MRWCPAPDCTNAVKVSYNIAKTVMCLCGFSFWYVIKSLLMPVLIKLNTSFSQIRKILL